MKSYAKILIIMTALLALWELSTADAALPPDELVSVKVYRVEPFDFVYPDTKFSLPAETDITVHMARNEYEPITFALVAERDIPGVTIQISDLVAQSGERIRKENIEAAVVKIWRQAGVGTWVGKEVLVPELLLKDDTVPIVDAVKNGRYLPPSLPRDFRTDLVNGRAKQVWITVRTVPEENRAGHFKGTLRFIGGGDTIAKIDLNVKVLPILLPEARKTFAIYFRGRIDRQSREYLSYTDHLGQLRDIRRHGFNCITIYDEKIEDIQEAVARAAKEGFTKVVIMNVQPMTARAVERIRAICKEWSLDVFFYGADEPYLNNEKLQAHFKKSRIIHDGGGRVVTAITSEYADMLGDQESRLYTAHPEATFEPLDWPNLNLKFLSKDNIGRAHTPRRVVLETYYWQIMEENPVLHRLYSGYYLWRTGLDGIFPYCYQHLLAPVSPYNGGDSYERKNTKRRSRASLVTYPSQEGPIPTLQWEALREGNDDIRYLSLLTKLIDGADRDRQGMSRHALEDVLAGFEYPGAVNTGSQPFKAEKFRHAREKIVESILALQQE